MKFRILLLAGLALAPSARADSEAQQWIQILSTGKLTEKLRLWTEAQPRYSLSTGSYTTVLLRPALGYAVTPELSLWLGYGWTPLLTPTFRDEHRLWLQAMHVWKLTGVTLTQRLRSETRFISGSTGATTRLRYQLRAAASVAEGSIFSAVLYDEVFLNVDDALPAVTAGFDQNRFFAGVNVKLCESITLDLGYLWNAVRRAAPTNRTNHVAMVTLFHNFSLAD